ncbi:MAG: phosphoribosylaminoimidazolesuccinocarboxamide synthase, partial [Candidatus Marinimicrobia bacterium]|nr:phosphoribosylaminoimidazolesuccinocarboxamide synthase [Candidatus Neomarinimicrobiota bacterium]
MESIKKIVSPQLDRIHSGKVRDSFRIDDKIRMIVATDRLSSFDSVLETLIPGKGAILNSLATFWFDKTKDIIDNHLVKSIHPNISLVKEAKPIKLEMIVRAYITGSAWRKYQEGGRELSGQKVPDGLEKNQAFSTPIVTPTTKEKSDREITEKEIIAEKWTTQKIYDQMKKISLKLFERGQKLLSERGIILVDTKYEFGLIGNKLILIDEIHTPDSSRFWSVEDYKKNPSKVEQIDKEFVRNYLMANKIDGQFPTKLPSKIVKETQRRYNNIYTMITGKKLNNKNENAIERMKNDLIKQKYMKDGFVAIIMGSKSDLQFCKKIKEEIEKYDIFADMRIVSAHKNGERILEIADEYNNSMEPGAVIAVAGRSNGLGGALSANLNIPVFNCPPFKDKIDLLTNVNSSLMMPSNTPAATVTDPKNAALISLRSLNIKRLKDKFSKEIVKMKAGLKKDDE